MNHRVVVTGMGIVSPLGNDLDTFWGNLRDQQSGIGPIDSLPKGPLPFQSGAEAKGFVLDDIEGFGPLDNQLKRSIKKSMKVMCREIQMGVAAAQKTLTHSELTMDQRSPDRCGVVFGCDYILSRPEEFSDGAIACRDEDGSLVMGKWPTFGIPKVAPLWLLKYLPNMPNSHIAINNDFRGPNNSLTVREASMNLALAEASAVIARGAADAIIVGATGTRIHPLRTAHVYITEKTASERTIPAQMSCPFDRDHDGMVVGEGAGALLIESLEHAQRRNATIWGEVIGVGSSMVGPESDTQYICRAVELALQSAIQDAGDKLPDAWHLHAHGQSAPEVDRMEASAIGKIFSQLGKKHLVTAAKSYFGNLGSGGAAVELIASILALKHRWLFPILNLNQPIPEATWSAARAGDDPGEAVVHVSFTNQGQCSTAIIAKFAG